MAKIKAIKKEVSKKKIEIKKVDITKMDPSIPESKQRWLR